MARVVKRKRARKRLAAKRKNVVLARPQVTTSMGPRVTPLRQILHIVAAIIKLWLSILAAILVTFFRFLSYLR
jgi:hypothetical protein